MASKTDIVNMALIKIGQKTVSSITEDTPTATKLNAVYDQILDEALAAGPEKGWKFARAKETLSVDSVTPDSTYEYRYAIPSDCLRIARIHIDGEDITDWVRQGQYILTNQSSDEVNIDYVSRITNTGLFPPHFIIVLYMMLAYHLSFNIVQEKRHANALFDELHLKSIPKAIALDGQEQYVQEESSSWVDAGRTTSTLE